MKAYLKKTLSVLLAFVMIFGVVGVGIAGFGSAITAIINSAEENNSGETEEKPYVYDEENKVVYYCGTIYGWLDIAPEDLETAVLAVNDEGVLRIEGSAIPDYTEEAPAPWSESAAEIKAIALLDGVTAIGANAFKGCSGVAAVFIPASAEKIGANAFAGCTSLKKVYYEGTWEEWEELVPDNLAAGLSGVNVTPNHTHDTAEPENREVFRDPTCHTTKNGLGYYSDIYCADCGTVYIPYKAITQVAHSFPTDENGDYIYTVKEEYTCEELAAGLLKYSECSVCGVSAETELNGEEAADVTIIHDWEVIALVNENGESVSCDDADSEPHYLSRKCAFCEEEDTELLYDVAEHSADGEYKEEVKADCLTEGYTEYKCAICKNIYKVNIEAAWGHDFAWVVTKEPNCKEEGLKVMTCQTEGCNATDMREYIPKTDCVAIIDEEKSVAPTCTTVGVNYYKCEMCGEPLDEKTENLDALGHSEVYELVEYPDCVEGGIKITKCAHEGCEDFRQENIPAGQHTWEEKYFAPACDEIGYTAVICTKCDAEKEDSRVDDEEATPHTWTEWEVFTEAACGVDEVQIRYCTAETCPEATVAENGEKVLFSEMQTIEASALEHEWTATKEPDFCHIDEEIAYVCTLCEAEEIRSYTGVGHTNTEEVIAPTCTTEGYTIFTCQKCPGKYVGDFVPALGHDMGEWETNTAEGCETAGEKVRYCKAEGCEYSETEEISAAGHTATAVKAVEPTCTQTGISEDYIYCSVCNVVLDQNGNVNTEKKVEDFVVPAAGHTPETDAAVAATCTETGLTEGSHCSVCDEIITAQEIVDALGHDIGEWETVTEAGCETAGEKARYCKAEGCEYSETEEIPATGHTPETDVAVGSTCTETGLTEGSHCSVCDEIITAQDIVAVLGHDMGEWTTVTEAGCETAGEMKRECSREGCEYYETKAITATGHTAVADAAVAPSCTETGLTAGSHCSVCGNVIIAQETVSALNHDMGEWNYIKEATCTTDGRKRQDCERAGCDHYVAQDIPAIGHNMGEWATVKAPTCEDLGRKERRCLNCGEIEAGDVAKTEHDYSDWNTTKKATAFDSGEEERICNDCGHSETRTYELSFFEKIADLFTSFFGGILDGITQLFRTLNGK